MLEDPTRRLVLAARDRLGIRPLCYAVAGDRLRYAAEAGSVAALPGQSQELDETQIVYQLALAWPEAESTLYRSVRRLPAGCRLTLREGVLTVTRYWTLEVPERLHLASDDEYAERFAAVLASSVQRRLKWCRRPVAELSGGLDSSLVATCARDGLDRPLPVVTAAFPGVAASDESAQAAAVVATGGFLQSTVLPLGIDSVSAGLLRGLDEPFVLPNAAIHAALFAGAAAAEADLVLTGEGGDELFTDSGVALTELLRQGRPAAFAREALALRRAGVSLGEIARRRALAPFAPGPAISLWRRLTRRPPAGGIPLRPEVARRAGLAGIAARQGDVEHAPSAAAAAVAALSDPGYDRGFADLARIGSRFGLAVTHPFFAIEMVEFGLSLPPDQRPRARPRNGERVCAHRPGRISPHVP